MAHKTHKNIDLLQKAFELDSGKSALISLKDLFYKASFESGMDKATFDHEVLRLADTGLVWLHSHAFPRMANENEVVWDKADCYMGLVIR